MALPRPLIGSFELRRLSLFAEDLYWNIPFDRACAVDIEPPLDLGPVVDDVESIREFLSDDLHEPSLIWHECEHIGGVLRSITRLDLSG